jgi:VanZ family protein
MAFADVPPASSSTLARHPLPIPVFVARVAGLLTVVAIGVLSLVPGSARPHIAWPWNLEHATAYLAAAVLLSLGFLGTGAAHRATDSVRALTIGGLLASYGAALEALQYFVPGRTPSIADLGANIAGTGLGIGLVLILRSAAQARSDPKRG